MSDLINRQDAIDAINRKAYRHTYIEQIIDIIENLPSAQEWESIESPPTADEHKNTERIEK